MQKIILERTYRKGEATLGRLILDGKEICKTLENPWLDNKTDISCIPEGEYLVKKYSSEKYPDVWELQNVCSRTYILIHNGNIEKNTKGCILVGTSWGFLKDELAVLSSKPTLVKLRSTLDDEFLLKITQSK